MLPQFSGSISMVVLFWFAFTGGLLAGAAAGFEADHRGNATVDYDAENQTMQFGNNVSDLREPPENETTPEWQQETEANINETLPELNDPQFLPGSVGQRVDNYSHGFVNNTLDTSFSLIAAVGDPTATFVYDNRDWLHRDAVAVSIIGLQFAPFVLIGYGAYRKFKSDER